MAKDPESRAPMGDVAPEGTAPSARPASLDSSVQARLGRHLRDHYSTLIQEPIPDDLMRLLDQLDGRDRDGGQGSQSS